MGKSKERIDKKTAPKEVHRLVINPHIRFDDNALHQHKIEEAERIIRMAGLPERK